VEFHEKVYSGTKFNGVNGEHYDIWPSKKYRGYFYIQKIVFDVGKELDIVATKKPISALGIEVMIENIDNIDWEIRAWDGIERNPFDEPTKGQKNTAIYFIEAEGTNFIKIGRGFNRIDSLQTGCPFPLRLVGEIITKDTSLEYKLHKKFHKYHHMNEWFYYSEEIRNYIKENAK